MAQLSKQKSQIFVLTTEPLYFDALIHNLNKYKSISGPFFGKLKKYADIVKNPLDKSLQIQYDN